MPSSDAAAGRQPAPRISDPEVLHTISQELRRDLIKMIAPIGQGYVQQGLGAADLFASLYFSEMRLDPDDPAWPDRDRFVLSTAHNSGIFYATLAKRGLIDAALIEGYCKDGSPLEINTSERLGPVIEGSFGSLGQGLSVAVGMACALKRKGSPARVYVVLGDGEIQEGQVWEATLAAAHFELDNLCLIVDLNNIQVEGHTDKVMRMEPVGEKWAAFGWHTINCDGNDHEELLTAFAKARATAGEPTCIVAKTLVGKGSPLLEGILAHNIKLDRQTTEQVLAELGDRTQ
ncbi:MAG: transketolase [Rhizobiaceae bacterium]|nr:transketolase [Rhizobiaceae bacterium]